MKVDIKNKILKQNSELNIDLYSRKYNGLIAIFVGKGSELLKTKIVNLKQEQTSISLDL